MTDEKSKIGESFSELVTIMAELRGERGCPWDKKQTHSSLKPFLLEEAYELLEAIDRGNPEKLEEELGDLLHQIVFHCQIASEDGRFDAGDVLRRLKEKITRRHPHVFSDRHLPDTETVLRHWMKAKAEENQASSLGDLPRSMPALARAQRTGERASYFGFDWPGPEEVWTKVEEELSELKKAMASGAKGRIREEMGDLLFCLANLARFFDLQAEEALSEATDRFLARFAHIERRIREQGKTLSEASLKEMDALWDEAKKIERNA